MPFVRFAVVFAFVIASGCGGSREAEISGDVRFDGKPVEQGAVSFFPVDGKSPTSGAVIVGGSYKAKVPYGEMLVRISAPKVIGRRKLYANNPNSPEADVTAEALPERYNEKSELKIEVKEAVIRKDFDLTK